MNVTEAVRREARGLWAGGTGMSLLAVAVGWGLLNGTRMIYPVLLPYFSDEYGLTLTTAGLLVTIVWLCYAIGQVPGGFLADSHGERTMLALAVTAASAALVIVILAPSATVLFVATGLFGLGISQYPIARITVLSDLYPNRIGRALGVTMATGDVGQTVLPPIASALAVAVAWQLGLAFVLPALGLAAIVLWRWLPSGGATETRSNQLSSENLRYVVSELRNGNVISLGIILFLFLFVWQTFSAFYPTYLTEMKGLSPMVAGTLFGLFFAIGVIVKPLAGITYDAVGLRASLPVVLSGAIIGLAALPFINGFWPLVGVTVLISTMLGSGAITQSFLAETLPADIQGTGLGLVRSSASVLAATGPVVFGAIADRNYFDEGYFLLAGIVALVTLVSLVMPTD